MPNGKGKSKRVFKSKKTIKKSNRKNFSKNRKYSKKNSKVDNQLSMYKKLMKLNTQSFYMGIRQVNPLSSSTGKVSLVQVHPTTLELPVHIYPLSNIEQSGSTQTGLYRLHQNCFDFVTSGSPNLEYLGNNGNTIQNVDNLKVRKLIHNYTSINLCLRGKDSKKSLFTCYLVKFKEDLFDPVRNPTLSGSTDQRKRKSFFGHIMRKSLNPIIQNENTMSNDVRRSVQILWKKNYVVREKLSTEDQMPYKVVKIFRKLNQIVSYTNDGNIEYYSTDPDVVEIDDTSINTFRNYPNIKDNMFLIICCDAESSNSNSYDISVLNKFTSSERISQT